ncbi:peptidyl-prolyl cis-trans isomerase B (cyclophilin B) [Okibacterium sp. HSC-33S16]|uniref:peptidylprolyl isomerase n=1 Tax=Okibacterium sp. HSC-33S16 TaxID=2910965 RepID=UPI0020A1308F|nr:peptidylprolyl isomerase [Okibacterium sp. HSC-33S16]MCP2030826.1 peptidyl-prolyl cis-trans isomerase B (cyclophilin B) [Okibacterium sp. HSC-33S16]
MAPSRTDERQARENRERLKGYKARRAMHEYRVKRRVRDNWIAGVALVVIAAAVTAGQIAYFSAGPGAPTAEPTPSASPSETAPAGTNMGDVPDADLAEGRVWAGSMTVNDIDLGIEVDGAAAPQGVSSFLSLSQSGFYNGISCHRLTNGGFFVLQCGDPEGTGAGGPGYSYGPIENAPEDNVYPAGTLAMARQSDNAYSMGSQFFIVYDDTTIPSDTAGGYTVLGKVTSGLDELKAQVVDAGIADGSSDGTPAIPVSITSVTLQ